MKHKEYFSAEQNAFTLSLNQLLGYLLMLYE
jgi:hypothetical protein